MSLARSFHSDPHGMIFIHASCDQPLMNSPITKLSFVIFRAQPSTTRPIRSEESLQKLANNVILSVSEGSLKQRKISRRHIKRYFTALCSVQYDNSAKTVHSERSEESQSTANSVILAQLSDEGFQNNTYISLKF